MDLKNKSLNEKICQSDTEDNEYLMDNKERKKSKLYQNDCIMKENLTHQMLNPLEFITKDIPNNNEDIINPFTKENNDTQILELTTEKTNIDTENTNIVNINNEVTESPELKRNFSFKNSKIFNTSNSNINKIDGLPKSSSNKSINTIINSQSSSRLFFDDSKSKNILSELNFDNIKRAPANDYDNLFSACRRGDLSAVLYFIENCKLNNLSKVELTEKEVINKRETESMLYIEGEKKCIEEI